MRKILLLVCLPFSVLASNIEVTNVRLDPADSSLRATVTWDNAWRNDKNYDAAWIFFKAKRRGYVQHMAFEHVQPEITRSNVPVTLQMSSDHVGMWVYASNQHRGRIEADIRIKAGPEPWNALNQLDEILAFGIELVYIPEGPFTLGEPDTAYLAYGGLYVSDANGNPDGYLRITSEDMVIPVGPEQGALYYRADTQYEGDQKGPIPATFPKGYQAFYIMKYEPTQGQYVDFLNTLNEGQSHNRANFAGKTYYERRGSIRLEGSTYVADYPSRPCNYMSWDDAMAYADWSGLRPITELEFVKAARGPGKPLKNEYPWNTGSYEGIEREMKESGDIYMPDEANLTDDNRLQYGASYYWVMDLAGSMWERVISIGSERGRAFTGNHGNGRITGYGFANEDGWPTGVDGPGGFGFRGGGYYVYPMNYTEFNPYSPIAYRRYGGWAGGNRKEAYGARFGRTAE